MIASLRGQLAHAEATSVILDVGGVGYKVTVPASIHGCLPSRRSRPSCTSISICGRKKSRCSASCTPDDQKGL